jgi:diguanylate cyclase (GGDEF)-like protein/PAS domain S-box-containing protein
MLGLAGLGSWLLSRSWSLLVSEKAKFRTFADFTYDWETWIDQNGHYVYCSPSCVRITGRSANEFINDIDLFLNITHPDDRALMEAHLRQHSATDAPSVFEFRIELPDRQVRWLEHACQSVFSEAGAFLGRRATNRDITDRTLAKDKLRDSEARLKEIFENLSSAVAVYQASPDGQDFIITTFNSAAERIENKRREDCIGKNVVDVFPGIVEFGLLEIFRRIWQSGVAEQFPISFYQDGHITGWRNNYVYKLPSGEIAAIYDDITKEKQAEEQMRHLAHYDTLTNLPNRTLLTDRLQQSLATAKRDKTHIALMFLDLDKFKPVNDELGHDVGDQLLKEVAKRLLNCVRESDTVSRIGGDEFMVLLPAIEAEQDAMLVTEKILYALNQPFELAGHSISIAASIGVAVYPEHGSDEKMLTKNADVAMYYAKSCGRNNAQIYRASMSNL